MHVVDKFVRPACAHSSLGYNYYTYIEGTRSGLLRLGAQASESNLHLRQRMRAGTA